MTIDAPIHRDQTLAATHRAVWALGDYALMAEEVMAPLGPILVAATGMAAGHRVLDVAAGSGNISLPGAKTGATVISTDLTPELLQRSKARAAELGLALDWREANAHALPFPDGEFDVVMSAIGVMFAPDQQCAADEMIRVCRSGGTIAVISWTPDGFFGRMLATIRPYRPALSAAVPPAAMWGRKDYADRAVGRSRHRHQHTTRSFAGGSIPYTRGRPPLLQEPLRPDDRGFRHHRRQRRAGRRPGRPAHRTRTRIPDRRRHGMGIHAADC